MMDNRKIPAPFYAAAGAGDLAYRKLRELSDRVAEGMRTTDVETPLRNRAGELRTRAEMLRERANEHDFKADMNRWMEEAQRQAQLAQQKATRYYHDLIVHGERVIRGAEHGAAHTAGSVATVLESTAGQSKTGEVSRTEIGATDRTAELPHGGAATTAMGDGDGASGTGTKPVKRTRPTPPRKQPTA